MLVLLLGCSSEAPALCSDPLRLEGDVLVAEGHCGYVELRAEVHGEGELEVSFTEVEGGLQPEISGADQGQLGDGVERNVRPPPFFEQEVPSKGPNVRVEVEFVGD